MAKTKKTFEQAFGDLRSILQERPVDSTHVAMTNIREWANQPYRRLDAALRTLSSLDAKRAREEVDPYVGSVLEANGWCKRPAGVLRHTISARTARVLERLALAFPSAYFPELSLGELASWASEHPGYALGLTLSREESDQRRAFASHEPVEALRFLHIEQALGDATVERLRDSPLFDGLTHLSFRGSNVTGQGLKAIMKAHDFDGLEWLDLSYTKVDMDILRVLLKRSKASLRALDLSHISRNYNHLCTRTIAKHTPLTSLRAFRANAMEFGASGFREFAASRHIRGLERLDIQGCALDASATRAYFTSENASNLRVLDLTWGRLSRGGLAAIEEATFCPTLRSLSLQFVRPDLPDLEALAGAPFERLRYLNLSNCELSARTIAPLLEAPWMAGLERLDVRYNTLGASARSALEELAREHGVTFER